MNIDYSKSADNTTIYQLNEEKAVVDSLIITGYANYPQFIVSPNARRAYLLANGSILKEIDLKSLSVKKEINIRSVIGSGPYDNRSIGFHVGITDGNLLYFDVSDENSLFIVDMTKQTQLWYQTKVSDNRHYMSPDGDFFVFSNSIYKKVSDSYTQHLRISDDYTNIHFKSDSEFIMWNWRDREASVYNLKENTGDSGRLLPYQSVSGISIGHPVYDQHKNTFSGMYAQSGYYGDFNVFNGDDFSLTENIKLGGKDGTSTQYINGTYFHSTGLYFQGDEK
jgi:hypothetical protein